MYMCVCVCVGRRYSIYILYIGRYTHTHRKVQYTLHRGLLFYYKKVAARSIIIILLQDA